MSKKKKIIIIAIVIIAIAGAAWFFMRKKGSEYDGLLLQGNGPEVYFIENGKKRHLTSWEKGAQVGLTPDRLQGGADAILATLSEGAPI